jgi:cytochrome c oxidase assembly protein subunit 15
MAVTHSLAGRAERLTITERQLRPVAYAALATLTLIIFSGAAVRLTGSGLGCHDWPKCTSTHALPALQTHALIEFGNRTLTGVVGLPCLLAAIGVFRLRPFRRDLVLPAVLLPLGVLAQAVLGGLTVLFDLSWQMVIVHYLVSAALLVAGAVLVWRLRRGPAPVTAENPRSAVLATRVLGAFGACVVVAGTFATAAGPHAGGAGTHDYVERLHVWGAGTLKTLIHLHGHAGTVLGLSAIAVWLWARHTGAKPPLRKALTVVGVLIALQGAIGLIQYHTQLPAGVVWVHASLAAVLWLSLVFAVLAAGRARRA